MSAALCGCINPSSKSAACSCIHELYAEMSRVFQIGCKCGMCLEGLTGLLLTKLCTAIVNLIGV